MNLLPFIIASLAPIIPPKALQMAMGIAMLQMIVPLIKNKVIEPALVARFTILALAEACRKSIPIMVIKESIKKLPVPGPIKPS